MSKPYLVISSPVDTYSGYGARGRDFVKALINLDKYDVKIIPQRWGATPEFFLDDNEEWTYLKEFYIEKPDRQPDIWIQHTIPSEFQKVGKFNIGLTAGIETTAARSEWVEGLNRMDLIIGSSNHTINSFNNSTYEKVDKRSNNVVGVVKPEVPMEVLFEGIDTEVYKIKKSKFNLNKVKEDFCFLFVGHWMQGNIGEDRKNVGLLVKGFLELFKNNKNAPALILKTCHGNSSILDRNNLLKKIDQIKKGVNANRLPNIYLVHGDLTNEEMSCLYNHKKIKAMVSLTKGEGFGRPLLEFTATKKPVIASGWSGHVDFLDKDLSILLAGELKDVDGGAANEWIIKDSKWFNVDLQSFAGAMMVVFNNYKEYLIRAKKQGTKNIKNFSLNNMQSKLDEILDKYIPEFPKQVQLNLPKLKLPKLDKKINSTLPKLQLPKLEKPKIDSKKETFPKLEKSK
jgi:hypothetical protein